MKSEQNSNTSSNEQYRSSPKVSDTKRPHSPAAGASEQLHVSLGFGGPELTRSLLTRDVTNDSHSSTASVSANGRPHSSPRMTVVGQSRPSPAMEVAGESHSSVEGTDEISYASAVVTVTLSSQNYNSRPSRANYRKGNKTATSKIK